MLYRWSIVLFFACLTAADLPQVSSLRQPQATDLKAFPSGENIQVMPVMLVEDTPDQGQAAPAPPKSGTTLSEASKLALIRYVSGEFAKARKPLPGGKDGFIIFVDKPLNLEYLDRAVANHGAAINTGDNVQISNLEFRDNSIVVDLNGGGRPKKHWRDRIQIGMGGMPVPQTTTPQDPQQEQGPPGVQPGMGATIYVDFPQHVPELSPDQLKEILAPFLDFTKVRSASVHWIDTLPTATQKAITERHAIIGMDRDEVIAAMGKPDRKVRERDTNGNDTEDWIYGHPPDKTIFVKFTSEKVSAIKQFPQ
ncbi:MAG TPA: hypothetical protein VKH45_04685 [Candidatus Acidoferrum sp.]|nr:hypothetical protein [Candidatus Acidoferrum sp.]